MSTIKYMLKLFRMWQFTRLVSKMTTELYTDSLTYNAYKAWGNIHFPEKEACIDEFGKKLHYVRKARGKKLATAKRTFDSCLENGYVRYPDIDGKANENYLQVTPAKGEDFIEMCGYGYVRELIFKEWKVATIFFGAVFSSAVYLYKMYHG